MPDKHDQRESVTLTTLSFLADEEGDTVVWLRLKERSSWGGGLGWEVESEI